MRHLKIILSFFAFMAFSCNIDAQVFEKVNKKLSIDMIASGGALTILDPEHKNKTYISQIGAFESSKGYFFETGIELSKKLKHNSLKTGLYYGYSNVTLRGTIPTNLFVITIFIDPFPIAREDAIKEPFEAQVDMHRLSIPVSYILESKSPGKLKIDHEFGMLFDLKIQSNFAEVEKEIILVPEFIIHSNSDVESTFSIPNKLGIRLLYGFSAELSPKVSFSSNFRFGLFETYPIERNTDLFSTFTQREYYNSFDRSVFGYFEMGFGLKYKLK